MTRLQKAVSVAIASIAIVCMGLVMLVFIYPIINPGNSLYDDITEVPLKDLESSQIVNLKFEDKPSVLLFFTSWCPYCNEDAPKIVELHNKYKDKVNVYGINVIQRDELSEVVSYVDEHGINYPVLLDETNELYEIYGSTGFPSLFFVTPHGALNDYIVGSADQAIIEQSFLDLIEQN